MIDILFFDGLPLVISAIALLGVIMLHIHIKKLNVNVDVSEVLELMATFKEQLAEVLSLVGSVKEALVAETAQIKAQIADLEAKLADAINNPDLQPTIDALKETVANIEAISDFEVPPVEPPVEG